MQKEVDYNLYCACCVNYSKDEGDDPCNACLTESTNEDSHKPIYFRQDPTKDAPVLR